MQKTNVRLVSLPPHKFASHQVTIADRMEILTYVVDMFSLHIKFKKIRSHEFKIINGKHTYTNHGYVISLFCASKGKEAG